MSLTNKQWIKLKSCTSSNKGKLLLKLSVKRSLTPFRAASVQLSIPKIFLGLALFHFQKYWLLKVATIWFPLWNLSQSQYSVVVNY